LFWADLWVVEYYVSSAQVGTYAAVGRISQVLLLFLTSVNLLFSPFAADLYARGQHERLDSLFKSATRWALAATIPTVIILGLAAPLSAAYGIEGAAVASAVTLGSVNLLRLGQVKHVVHIQPYTLDYLRLALPTGACLAAALIVHSATSQSVWYLGLVATGLAAGAAYLALL